MNRAISFFLVREAILGTNAYDKIRQQECNEAPASRQLRRYQHALRDAFADLNQRLRVFVEEAERKKPGSAAAKWAFLIWDQSQVRCTPSREKNQIMGACRFEQR